MVKVEVTNKEELKKQILDRFFEIALIAAERMRKTAISLELIGDGSGGVNYAQAFIAGRDDNSVWVENASPHAVYLEYGTYAYFDRFGTGLFPNIPDGQLVDPKKKDVSKEERKYLPMGMQPFACMRRTLYNEQVMNDIARMVFSNKV